MPKQRSIFSKPVALLPQRRIRMAFLLGLTVFAFFILLHTFPRSKPEVPSFGKFRDHRLSMPKLPRPPSILNPFRPAAHPPPIQKNSTSGEASWHSNWNWLSPFSSSVTLDENRSLLPPLHNRPPIYTYYDHTLKKDKEEKDAENAILVTWRRAWWAQGFKPIILSPAEAINNPLSAELRTKDIDAGLKIKLSRWLAWENMGTGLLCDYLLLPMGSYEHPLLEYLRRGEYPKLTRFDNLGSGLFAGSKPDITAAVKQALAKKDLNSAKDFISAVSPDTFIIEPKHEALAYYDVKTIADKYPKIADEIMDKGAKGLMVLNQLTVSHLHSTWQNIFNEGIAVVKPIPDHMTVLTEGALRLATFLAQCPESPMPASCPPNLPRCKPCVASHPLKISTPPAYLNTTGLYTIGTVPHPFTTALLTSKRYKIDVPWIRRVSGRDLWITSLTKELLGTGLSGPARVIKFKEAVASEYGTSHSLWVTAEKPMPRDLDWHFGFTIPMNATSDGKSETPVPGPERRPKKEADPRDGPIASEDDEHEERKLIEKAIQWNMKRSPEEEKIHGAIEGWNLADMEAWRFTRAFLARKVVERLKWEEEEQKYAGGARAEWGQNVGWGRWFDDYRPA